MRRKATFLLTLILAAGSAHAQTTYKCSMVNKSDKSDKMELSFLTDASTGKAYVVGNNGSAIVEQVRGMFGGISFVETTLAGNVATTTITSKGKAVHSRNMVIGPEENLIASQYVGTCTRK